MFWIFAPQRCGRSAHHGASGAHRQGDRGAGGSALGERFMGFVDVVFHQAETMDGELHEACGKDHVFSL